MTAQVWYSCCLCVFGCSAAAAEFGIKTPAAVSTDSETPLQSEPMQQMPSATNESVTPPAPTPAIALAAADSSTANDSEPSNQLDLPSKAIVLERVWDPLAPLDDATAFFDELESDMRAECATFGAVEHVR